MPSFTGNPLPVVYVAGAFQTLANRYLCNSSDQVLIVAVANLGPRPTFDATPGLEVHLLDYTGDLYGRELEVVFRKRLRDVRKFANADELVAQIGLDVEAARHSLTV